MTSTNLLTAVATAAVLMSGTAFARQAQVAPDQETRVAQDTCRDDARDSRWQDYRNSSHKRHDARVKPVLWVVPNSGLQGEASYGWQYFSNPRAKYAVVISPAGEYFLSRGDGPRQITGPEGQVLMARSAQD